VAAREFSISGSGSIAPVFVVPAFATTRNGRRPAALSSAIMRSRSASTSRRRASTGTRRNARSGKPAIFAAFGMQACVSSEKYITPSANSSPSSATRAATIAARFEIEPPLVNTPFAPSGMPMIRASHPSVTFSISASAGAGGVALTKRFVKHAMRSARPAVGIPPPGM
jgi:hypothetical protein